MQKRGTFFVVHEKKSKDEFLRLSVFIAQLHEIMSDFKQIFLICIPARGTACKSVSLITIRDHER